MLLSRHAKKSGLSKDMGWQVHPKGVVGGLYMPTFTQALTDHMSTRTPLHRHFESRLMHPHPWTAPLHTRLTPRLLFGHSSKGQGLWSHTDLSLNPDLVTSS